MSRNSKEDFDDILEEIAKKIYGKVVVDGLGKKLGFTSAETDRYNEENTQQGVSYMGTLHMLRKWRQDQDENEERGNLKAALEKAGLKQMANQYFSAGDLGQPSPVPIKPPREGDHDKVEPDEKGYYNQPVKEAILTQEQLVSEKNYKMDALPKGNMFIFNMSEARKGSDVDVRNMTHVFNEIGFKIRTYFDLTAKELTEELDQFVTSTDHKGMCSAVFLLMAHGSKAGIRCTDNMVTTNFIMEKVSGMKYMNGKPKIVFFQCCRGEGELKKVESDQAEADIVIPAESDVFMVHATTDGNKAYRTGKGSWFIQKLCQELIENAHRSDLSTMLEQVTEQVGKMGPQHKGQCVVVTKQGIRKKIYFLPKYPQPMQSPAEQC